MCTVIDEYPNARELHGMDVACTNDVRIGVDGPHEIDSAG